MLSYLILKLVMPSLLFFRQTVFFSSLLSVRPLSADGGRFHLLRESQAGCGSFRNTTLAGCYVEIAPIWNVIKVVWLLASGGKTHSIFPPLPSSQMKMYSVFG